MSLGRWGDEGEEGGPVRVASLKEKVQKSQVASRKSQVIPTTEVLGLKQGRFVSRATRIVPVSFFKLGFRPRTKVIFFTCDLRPATCLVTQQNLDNVGFRCCSTQPTILLTPSVLTYS